MPDNEKKQVKSTGQVINCIIAFVSGFAMMSFELVGARILTPAMGSSTYIWTNVIGMIMLALTIGYAAGGRLADKRSEKADVAVICILTAALVTSVFILKDDVLGRVIAVFSDPRLQGLFAALILFVPSSFLLGMISPYLVKLNLKSLESSGKTVARLSSMNAIGSITGTFLTGFVFFELIGSSKTLLIIIFMLIASSWLLVPKQYLTIRIIMSLTIAAALFINIFTTPNPNAVTIDSPLATYIVKTEGGVVNLITHPRGVQSAVYKDDRRNDELIHWYTNEFASAASLHEAQNILVLGGGAFVFPSYLAKNYPGSVIDVVEIDPALEDVSKEFFHFEEKPNLNLIFDDARIYVNNTDKRYDLIFVDVFSEAGIPWQFTTAEYGKQIARIASPEALVIVNMIAVFEGDKELFQVLDAPYSANFNQSAHNVRTPERRGNIIGIYSNNLPILNDSYKEYDFLNKEPFTDDFAPTEHINFEMLMETKI